MENQTQQEAHSHSGDVTLVFEPQSGGSVPERQPETNTLQQFVTAVFTKLNVTNAINPTAQRKDVPGILSLSSTIDTLGLHNGDKISLAWQTSGGRSERRE